MLDSTTKRRINFARDILVGKVPDPKSQVEQITIALIYKFMDDLDAENEELGDKRTFFTNNFAKYRWRQLIRPELGGRETLNLYTEAIQQMPQNPALPQLFRNILKNAYLPYNDPATLRTFLKTIDEFTYDHSERLGDAFEYLLSILGAQGDAGQFRTPRHIIDFIVHIINPQKNHIILDPACGTAGFLIAAYKHIRRANTDPDGNNTLTPNQRDQLANNLRGYDISPDMVRLSLVNMYLHRILQPNIHEYDTLTSQQHWNHYADIILANPPFMSPKGGIQPHNRFTIQSKRSEVLFVDYIAEHLTQNGRAGIIVPEGIIFQTQNAYKQLRKTLIENYLTAVISLPAGVFNPYSGVKTSILILDKAHARHSPNIAFFKIQNDGYDLGAQRRPINQNDLPQTATAVKAYLNQPTNNTDKKDGQNEDPAYPAHRCSAALIISKTKIAADGDYNLTADRYRQTTTRQSKFPMIKLGEVVLDMKDGGTPRRSNPEYFGGNINWAVVKDIAPEIHDTAETLTEAGIKNSSAKVWPVDSIIISLGATIGNVGIAKIPVATKQGLSGIVVDREKIMPEYLYHVLVYQKAFIQSQATGTSIKEVRPSKLKEILTFPLPPLETQQEIIAEIEVEQKAIDECKKLIGVHEQNIANRIEELWK